VVQLESSGARDGTFAATCNGPVHAISVQDDGRILLGGEFTECNETSRNRIARLEADGTLDGTFDPGPGFDSAVLALAVQGDGRIVAGGDFTSYAGTACGRIACLSAAG